MSVTIIIEVIHTANGLELKPEIKTQANGHCRHEMAFATALVGMARGAADQISETLNSFEHISGENKHVH